jgi:predicted nucleotidyltransferase
VSVIPEAVRGEIEARLGGIERDEQVRVLFAIESGSRAWGFPSPNSDYDVRFIYARPRDWYLSVDLERRRDVLEYGITDDIDLNGWDVRKALRLFGRSNPAFVEWLHSPITYLERGAFRENARAALPEVYAASRCIYHYRSVAAGQFRRNMNGPSVGLKKYFYVVRPLLSILWIESGRPLPPPIELEPLLEMVRGKDVLLGRVHELLALKKQSPELGEGDRIPEVDAFIDVELARLESFRPAEAPPPVATATLNRLFRAVLDEGEAS